MKGQTSVSEERYTNHAPCKEPFYRMGKELLHLNDKKKTNMV